MTYLLEAIALWNEHLTVILRCEFHDRNSEPNDI